LFEFGENAKDEKSRNFFGYNNGKYHTNSSGILTSQDNIIQTKCENVNRMVPYFQETVAYINLE